MGLRSALALLVAAVALGCVVTEEENVPMAASGGTAVIVRSDALRAWRVVDAGEEVGTVVLYARPDEEDQPRRQFYAVRNPYGQELGSIDGLGRAWRFVPHQREPDWVTTGTVREGARAILGCGPETELVEVPVDELRAGSRPNGRD
jgi:hypothetical protein